MRVNNDSNINNVRLRQSNMNGPRHYQPQTRYVTAYRVVFHAVGKILSGPNQWKNNEMGEMLLYHTVRGKPYLSVVVFPQSQSLDEAPTFKDQKAGDLVRIDLRLRMPNDVASKNA